MPPPEIIELPSDKLLDLEDHVREEIDDEATEIALGRSLELNQDCPLIVKRDATQPGFYRILDGHRRTHAARRVGKKTLLAIVVRPDITPTEITAIQWRTDLHKKKLPLADRYRLIKKIAAENPDLNDKQLAELLELNPATLCRILAADSLRGVARDALFDGTLGEKAAYEIGQGKPEIQPALLGIIKKGGTVADVIAERKRLEKPPPPPADHATQSSGDNDKLDKVVIAFSDAQVIARAKAGEVGLDLIRTKTLLVAAIKKIDLAIENNWSTKTAQKAWLDSSKKVAVEKPEKKKGGRKAAQPVIQEG